MGVWMNINNLHVFVCLQLSKKAQLDNKVKLITLAKTGNKIKANQKCSVAGWGFTKTSGKVVDKLQVVDVPIIDLNICKRKWKAIHADLPDSVICAGGYYTNKGFCKVSFLYFDKKKYHLISSLKGFQS